MTVSAAQSRKHQLWLLHPWPLGLGTEPRASHLLDKHSTTALYILPFLCLSFWDYVLSYPGWTLQPRQFLNLPPSYLSLSRMWDFSGSASTPSFYQLKLRVVGLRNWLSWSSIGVWIQIFSIHTEARHRAHVWNLNTGWRQRQKGPWGLLDSQSRQNDSSWFPIETQLKKLRWRAIQEDTQHHPLALYVHTRISTSIHVHIPTHFINSHTNIINI